jgi:hypothetical protein
VNINKKGVSSKIGGGEVSGPLKDKEDFNIEKKSESISGRKKS